MPVQLIPFGRAADGETIHLIRLINAGGHIAEFLTQGAAIHRLCFPDREGRLADVSLGQNANALHRPVGVGFVIGRCANRIEGGCYEDGGKTVALEKNAEGYTLHSESGCYARRLFAPVIENEYGTQVLFTLRDEGWAGFPGTLELLVRYTLTDEGALRIAYEACCTERTVLNITNHVYLNLAGHGSGPIDGQLVQINADYYLPNDSRGMPTGEILSVEGTALDLRTPTPFGKGFASGDERLEKFGGWDYNYCLRGRGLRKAAVVLEPNSGRRVSVFTDLPGLQLYTMNGLPDGISGKDGAVYGPHHAFCLETQHYPNAANMSHFPSPMVEAGQIWRSITEYRFDFA